MPSTDSSTRKKWAYISGILFSVAVIMGAGPGLILVNPSEGATREAFFFASMPIIYVWGVFWFAVQFIALLLAYRKVWTDGGER